VFIFSSPVTTSGGWVHYADLAAANSAAIRTRNSLLRVFMVVISAAVLMLAT
jgi:hypothetical protein